METRKSVTLTEFKLSDTGEFSALFAPFDKIDLQGDLTMPGAFGKQAVVISAYGHGSSYGVALPVGKGTIHDGETGGVVEGKFFLGTAAGKDTYEVVKELGDLQEWSYSLPQIDYEMRTIDGQSVRVLKKITVKEVSPVMIGAGIGTHTLSIKASDGEVLDHLESVMADVVGVCEWLKKRAAFRESEGRAPSALDRKRITLVKAQIENLVTGLGTILVRHDALSKEFVRFQAMLSNSRE